MTLLQGEEENDLTAARELLNVLTPDLLNKLQVRDCVDLLFEKRIISESDKEEIDAKEKIKGPIAATRLLLTKIPRKNRRWPQEFAKILTDHGLKGISTMFLGFEEGK